MSDDHISVALKIIEYPSDAHDKTWLLTTYAMAARALAAEVRRLRARLTPEGLVAAFEATGPLEWHNSASNSAHVIGMDGAWDFAEVIRALTGEQT